MNVVDQDLIIQRYRDWLGKHRPVTPGAEAEAVEIIGHAVQYGRVHSLTLDPGYQTLLAVLRRCVGEGGSPHTSIPIKAAEFLKALVWKDKPFEVRFGWEPVEPPTPQAQDAARLLHGVEDGERRSWLRGVFEAEAAARGEGVGLVALKAAMRGSDALG